MPAPDFGRKVLVPAFFGLSGASALVYETVWLRQVALVVGTTAVAVSTVLGVFMLGLGLGALWLGARADRSPSPLRLYACLELGIGIYALALPRIIALTRPLYVDLARAAAANPGSLMALRVALGFVLLLIPTLLMGATLPVLVRYARRGADRFGSDLGSLYATNLIGAVVGSLAAGFVLIRVLGVRGATIVASLVNLTVGMVALFWARWRPDPSVIPPAPASPAPAAPTLQPGVAPMLWAVIVASGFTTIAFETLWSRILVFSFLSTIYAFTIILATFLSGLALGSAIFARLEGRTSPLAVLASVQVLAGVSALLLAPLAARPTAILEFLAPGVGDSGALRLGGMALATALALFVPVTLMGLVFPLATKLLVTDLDQAGHRVGAAYLLSTLGCVAGSLVTGFLLVPLLGLKWCLVALCISEMGIGASFVPWLGRHRRRATLLAGGMLALAAAAVVMTLRSLPGPSPFDPLPAGARIEAHRDDSTASVSVVRYSTGVRSLRIDGFDASGDAAASGYMVMMTHIPMLLHPDPKRLLVICFGTGQTAGAGLLHPGAHVDVVDVNPAVFAFEGFFQGPNRNVARDPRARLVLDDGRNFLLTSRERYDVITSEPMPPHFAGVVNLYTREYYELARERLAPGGLVVQWLPMHLLTVPEALSVMHTMQEVFPQTTVWVHRSTGIVVARRDEPQALDVARLRSRLLEPGLAMDLGGVGVASVQSFVNLYTLDPPTLAQISSQAAAVTDDHPSLEFHNVGFRQSDRIGTLWAGAVRSLEILFRARRDVQVPLMGAPEAELAEVRAAYSAASFALLGDLYLDAGRPQDARQEYWAGSVRAQRPHDRALFYFALAQLASSERHSDEARELLERGLVLWPDNARARELHRQLTGS